MKFSDGVWQTAKGMGVALPHHVFHLAVSETEVVIEASSCPYRARFEDVDTAYFTIRLFSPAPNVIGVKFEHFRGLLKRRPAFEIASDPATKPKVVNEADFVSLSSGDLTVRVEKRDDWRLDVPRGDKRITGSALAGSGYAIEEESGRTCVFERLDLGVGDLLYGLGERGQAEQEKVFLAGFFGHLDRRPVARTDRQRYCVRRLNFSRWLRRSHHPETRRTRRQSV